MRQIYIRGMFIALALAGAMLFPPRLEAVTAAQYRAYGNQLYKEKKYSEALRYYEASYKLKPDPAMGDFIGKLRSHVGLDAPMTVAAQDTTDRPKPAKPKRMRFGFQVLGGYATYGLGDLKADAKYRDAAIAASPQATVSSKVTSSGPGFGIEGLFFLPFGLGFGIGYTFEGGAGYESKIVDNDGTSTFTDILDLSYSQLRIPLNLYYRKNLTDKFSLGIKAGLDLMTGTVDFTTSSTEVVNASGVQIGSSGLLGDFEGTGFGYHVGLDAEYNFTPKFSGFINFEYAIGKVTDFVGTLSNGSNTNIGNLVMVSDNFGSVRGEYLDFTPAGQYYSNERPFEIDTSGLRLNAGVRFLFP